MDTNIKTDDLIYPYFVVSGSGRKEPVKSFPGVFRFSLDRLLSDIRQIKRLGLDKILLFGVPEKKDKNGSGAYSEGNIVAAAVKKIKSGFPEMTVMTDVCLCAYTSHGHCGVVKDIRRGIDGKETLTSLARMAVSHAKAGADYVAPSAMAKGQVSFIRKALDLAGHKKTKIMSYSAKFASGFYGPFRNAARSAPKFGDRRKYQLDHNDAGAALARIRKDIDEGADIVMVKPALAYLDIIYRAKKNFKVPLAAYNVSGEYAMVKAQKGLALEVLSSIKRAGADLIITYHAKDVAKWLKN